jgi:hypothetical protein
VPIKQNVLDDLVRQINKLIAVVYSLIDRFARLGEEYDSNRLANEESREIQKELIEEFSRWAQSIGERLDRVEQYTVLSRMGSDTGAITQEVSHEHIERKLREELGQQQKLLEQYQRNINRVKLKIAQYGETTPLMNELDIYELEVSKVTEAIGRIRDALK